MFEPKHLGKQVGLQDSPNATLLDLFDKPENVTNVVFETDEFTSLCPVTGQPDFANVRIIYSPRDKCIESKSLKLYLQAYRQVGSFIETLASDICRHISIVTNAYMTTVLIKSVPRGGVRLEATAHIYNNKQYREGKDET